MTVWGVVVSTLGTLTLQKIRILFLEYFNINYPETNLTIIGINFKIIPQKVLY